jgi:hypothetical protein
LNAFLFKTGIAADMVALDNAQYQLQAGTVAKPVTVQFGTTTVIGSFNPTPDIGVTDPVARQQVVDEQIQAAANQLNYEKDLVNVLGSGQATNLITDAKAGNVDENVLLTIMTPQQRQIYDKTTLTAMQNILASGKTSSNAAQMKTLDNQLNVITSGDQTYSVSSGALLDEQNTINLANTAKYSDDAKITITSMMTDAQKTVALQYNTQIDAYNSLIDDAKNQILLISTPATLTVLNQQYGSIDKKQAMADVNAINTTKKQSMINSIIGVASASPDTASAASSSASSGSLVDNLLSYLMPQSTVKSIDSALGYAGNELNQANKYVSGLINLPSYDSIKPSIDAAQQYNPLTGQIILGEEAASIGYNAFANTGVGKTVLGTKVDGVSAGDIVSGISNINSGVSQGIGNFEKDEYTELKETPVTFLGENAAMYLAGAGLGKVIGTGGEVVSSLLGSKGAEVAIEAVEKSPIDKVLSGVGNLVGRSANLYFAASAINKGVQATEAGYQKGGIAGGVEAALNFYKDVALGTKGFEAGAGAVGSPVVLGLPTLKPQAAGKDLYTEISTMLGSVGSNAGKMISSTVNTGFNLANADIATALNYAGDISIKNAGSSKAPAIIYGKEMKSLAANGTPIQNVSDALAGHVVWDMGRLGNAAVGAVGFGGDVLAGDIQAMAMGDEKLAPYTSKLPDAKTLAPYAEKAFEMSPVGVEYQTAIDNINTALYVALKNSNVAAMLGIESDVLTGVKEGVSDFISEGYDYAREHPVTTAGEIGLSYLGGEVLGAGLKGLELAGTGGLAKTAEFAASKASDSGALGKVLWGGTDKLATVGAKAVPLVTKTGLGVGYASSVVGDEVNAYNKGGVAGATQEAMKQVSDFLVMGKGFQSGEEHLLESSSTLQDVNEMLSVGKYEPYTLQDVAPKINRIQIPMSDGKGANKDFTDWKTYGIGASLGNKPILSATTEGIF